MQTHTSQTNRQRRAQSVARAHTVYSAIIDHKRRNDGNSPSIRDLQVSCSITSSSVVNGYLRQLVSEGLIEMSSGGSSRSIRVLGGMWTYGPFPVRKGKAP